MNKKKKPAKKAKKTVKFKNKIKRPRRSNLSEPKPFTYEPENKRQEKQYDELMEFFGKENFNKEKHEKVMEGVFKKIVKQDSFTMRDLVVEFEKVAGDLPLRQLLWMTAKMSQKLTFMHIQYMQQMSSRPEFLIRQIFGL